VVTFAKIPVEALSPQALDGLIEEFVTRDGTELGDAGAKISAVRNALDRGDLVIVFDAELDSCNILAADEDGA